MGSALLVGPAVALLGCRAPILRLLLATGWARGGTGEVATSWGRAGLEGWHGVRLSRRRGSAVRYGQLGMDAVETDAPTDVDEGGRSSGGAEGLLAVFAILAVLSCLAWIGTVIAAFNSRPETEDGLPVLMDDYVIDVAPWFVASAGLTSASLLAAAAMLWIRRA